MDGCFGHLHALIESFWRSTISLLGLFNLLFSIITGRLIAWCNSHSIYVTKWFGSKWLLFNDPNYTSVLSVMKKFYWECFLAWVSSITASAVFMKVGRSKEKTELGRHASERNLGYLTTLSKLEMFFNLFDKAYNRVRALRDLKIISRVYYLKCSSFYVWYMNVHGVG